MTNVNDPKQPSPKQSLLGNELLNQFNVISDNHNGVIYLKKNTLQNENYATYRKFKIRAALVISGIVVLLAAVVLFIRKFIRRKKWIEGN